jgi:hypothetical protein
MCSTIDAFNSTLKSFLQELVDVFPGEPGIGKLQLFLATYDSVIAADPRGVMRVFLDTMGPHTALISSRDSTLFKLVELPGGVSLRKLWKKASESTRDATWQYLQMLCMLGTTATSVPPEMLAAIEGMAGEYAGKVKSGEMDLSAVTNLLLGGGGGVPDIAALFGGGGGGPPPPQA